MAWILLIAGLLLIAGAAVLWWLLIKTEGVYLGRGAVVWLYDAFARRYDRIKQFDPVIENVYLARPIVQRLTPARAPLVLDVATGTGRMPLALFEQPSFQGHIIALDLSRRMIALAAHKLAPYGARVSLLHYPAEALPFPDETFDLVTCMEALEFMMNPDAVLHELVRVLRPGGLLVITNRQGLDARLMPGRTWTHGDLKRRLCDDLGMARVKFEVWQVDYRLVWAVKPGILVPAGPLRLAEVWRCPRCGALRMVPGEDGWRCDACGARVPVGTDGVIEAAGVLVE